MFKFKFREKHFIVGLQKAESFGFLFLGFCLFCGLLCLFFLAVLCWWFSSDMSFICQNVTLGSESLA